MGKIFDPTEVQGIWWMKEFAQAPAVLICDSFVRVYFSCRPLPEPMGMVCSYIGYVDLDRNDLFKVINISKKPVLGLGDKGAFDEFGTMPISIIRDGRRILAYYGGWTRCESVPFNIAIGLAVSCDNGDTFTKAGNGPLLSFTPDEPFLVGVPKIRRFNNTWYLWYTAGKKWISVDGKPEAVYKIRMASSVDGLTWKRVNRDILPDKLDENEAQASPDVFEFGGRYHMFFCYRYTSDFRKNSSRGYRIGYAVSSDLFLWERDDAKAGINISESGWDSEMVSFPHVFSLDGATYMFYLGNAFGRFGFGAAKLI